MPLQVLLLHARLWSFYVQRYLSEKSRQNTILNSSLWQLVADFPIVSRSGVHVSGCVPGDGGALPGADGALTSDLHPQVDHAGISEHFKGDGITRAKVEEAGSEV